MTTAKTAARILVVDDEPNARNALTELLRDEGYEVQSAGDGFKALGRIDGWEPDVVITDVKMPALDGLELMRRLRERLPGTSVIVMTGFGSVEGAVGAMHLGAADYLTKPVHLPHLLLVLERVLAHRALQQEARRLRGALAEREATTEAGLVGETRVFRELVGLAHQVAETPASVLIAGEGGTGKLSLARLIHGWSGRRGPLVVVKCGALADAEAELFGDGAAQAGSLATASGGSLLLADVEQLPQVAQARLLRALQDQRLGDGVDVRVLATTTRDLAAEAQAGRFRQDLYYRLNVVALRVPALRERRDDIVALTQHILRRLSPAPRRAIPTISARALGVLLTYAWPGNIRQLEGCLERATAVARGREIEPRDLPPELLSRARADLEAPSIPGTTLHELERYAILRTLEHVGGSTSKAAKILGISPRKIQYRIQEYRAGAR